MPVVHPRIATAARVATIAAAGLLLIPAPADGGDRGSVVAGREIGLSAAAGVERGSWSSGARPARVAARGAPWRAPVAGAVVGRFRVGSNPFARGQRRGMDFAAHPGAPVSAPCGGRVSFAGELPRRRGTVAIRCGELTATVLGLELPLRVAAGEDVVPGSRIGAAADRRVRLGARRTAERFGYVDPERLLRGTGAPSPLAPPLLRARRGPRGGPPRTVQPAPPFATTARHAPEAGASPRAPLAAWIGLALVAVTLPAGALVARRRRARSTGAPVRAAARG